MSIVQRILFKILPREGRVFQAARPILRQVWRILTAYDVLVALLTPINYVLAILRRNVKHENSVLHISYMVHIPYYTVQILRRLGMKADYLAYGMKSAWWDKYDYHFCPPIWPPTALDEFFFFWRVVAKYEIIHSHFGIILTQSGWELPILKRMGRKIVMHYRGCEGRDEEKNRALHPEMNICQRCDYNGSVCREGKARVERIKPYVDLELVTTPDMKEFNPDAIHLPFFTPEIDYQKYAPSEDSNSRNGEFKIVHATNHPGIEGTEYIQQAIDHLKAKGHKINFVFLRGVKPERVLEELRDADLSIGKMKMGYYANAQIESMFLGVPAMTYVRPEFVTPGLENSGLIISHLDDLENALEYYVVHPDALSEKRRITRESVLRLHDNVELGKRLIAHYERIKGMDHRNV